MRLVVHQGIESVVRAAGCQKVFSKLTFIESFRDTLRKYLGEEPARADTARPTN